MENRFFRSGNTAWKPKNMSSLNIRSIKATESLLAVNFKCKGQLSKFFQTNQFYAHYSIPIQKVPEGILIIPFLSTILPIVWANHAEIYVNTVDETFLRSMNAYKTSLQKLYPKLRLGGKIIVKRVSKQHPGFSVKNMMLFSGGVDAQVTFLRHKNENLTLVCVHGAEIESEDYEAWKGVINPIADFALNNKCSLRTVRSNFKEMVDFLILRVYDGCIDEDNGWWGRVMHGLALIGLCAPLAYVERTGKLYIASSFTSDFSGGWGSHPSLDNTIKWTGTDVVHDGYELSRQEKLSLLSEHIKNSLENIVIRSCWYSKTGGNCSQCEKCSRTILGLELTGLNPNNYGFSITPDTFSSIKRKLLNGEWAFGADQLFMWQDIKQHAYLKKNIIHPEAEALIDWLETSDVPSFQKTRVLREKLYERKYDFGKKLNPVFMCLPDPCYRILKKIYFFIATHFPFLA